MATYFSDYAHHAQVVAKNYATIFGNGALGLWINSETYQIPDVEKKLARERFGDLGYDENILLIKHDTGWLSADWMLVITDQYFRYSYSKNEDEPLCVSWENLDGFFYRDGDIVAIFENTGKTLNFSEFFHFSDDYVENILEAIADALDGLAKSCAPEQSSLDILIEKWNKLMEDDCTDKEMKSFSEMAYEMQEEEKDDDTRGWILLIFVRSLEWINEEAKALSWIEQALQLDLSDTLINSLHVVKGMILSCMEERPCCDYDVITELNYYKSDQHSTYPEALLKEHFDEMVDILSADFLESMPLERRRYIMFGDYEKVTNIPQQFCLLPFDKKPKGIEIDGVVEPYVLYIRHPYNPNKYFLASEYDLLLFRDKVDEFDRIMTYLGAKHFSYSDTVEHSSNISSKKNIDANVEGGKKNIGKVSAHYGQEDEDASFFSMLNKYEKREDNAINPDLYPSVPDDTFWFEHEKRWKDEVDVRLKGLRNTLTFTISLEKSYQVSSRAKKELQAEFENLIVSVKGDGCVEKLFEEKQTSNHVWNCTVEFYPLAEYNKKAEVPSIQAVEAPSSNEQVYLEQVRDFLADGKIGESERRMLNRLCKSLGIPNERAVELEKSLQLSEDEQDYLDALKDAMVDGNISDAERRLLDKIKKYNNISDERAAEIERLV